MHSLKLKLKLKLKLIILNYKIGPNSGMNKRKESTGTIIFQVILLFIVYCLLFIVYYLLFIVCCLLFVVYCLLFVAFVLPIAQCSSFYNT